MSTETKHNLNPANGEALEPLDLWSEERIVAAIEQAAESFEWNQRQSFDDRASCLEQLAGLLEARRDDLARLMTTEMGKPITQSRSEIDKCAWVCRYYAENAAGFLESESVEADPDDQKAFIHYCPIGVVLAVMPWNFPFWQVFRFAAPAVMAGNVALLKHASNVPGCARAIQQLFTDAGFPDGVFTYLPTGHDGVTAAIKHGAVRAVTVTGSVKAGRGIAELAGANLKKSVLELGGSDPYLVFADADLDHAASVCAQSRLINSGQSCIAAKRFIVEASVHDAFVEKLLVELGDAVLGDPRNESTTVGPLARHDLCDQLEDQVRRSLDAGAACRLGDRPVADPGLEKGAYHPVTLLTDVEPGMPAFDEELFGPVASVIRADGEDDMIRLANATAFGLGSAVFTCDRERGERIARDSLDTGCVAVNQMVASDPRLPFGGVKDSGYGRELSRFGIREFVNVKTVTSAN